MDKSKKVLLGIGGTVLAIIAGGLYFSKKEGQVEEQSPSKMMGGGGGGGFSTASITPIGIPVGSTTTPVVVIQSPPPSLYDTFKPYKTVQTTSGNVATISAPTSTSNLPAQTAPSAATAPTTTSTLTNISPTSTPTTSIPTSGDGTLVVGGTPAPPTSGTVAPSGTPILAAFDGDNTYLSLMY
jgi:hypothetical protein